MALGTFEISLKTYLHKAVLLSGFYESIWHKKCPLKSTGLDHYTKSDWWDTDSEFPIDTDTFSFFTDHGYDSEIYANDQLVSAAKYQQNSPPISGTHNSRYIGNSKVRIVIPDKMCTWSGHSKPRGQ